MAETVGVEIRATASGLEVFDKTSNKLKQIKSSSESSALGVNKLNKSLRETVFAGNLTANIVARLGSRLVSFAGAQLRESIRETITLNQELMAVGTLFTDMSAGTAEFDQWIRTMTYSLRDMAGGLGTAQDLTKGLYQIVSAGLPKDTALETLRIMAETASAGIADLKDTTNLMVGVMNAYVEKGLTAEEVSNVLFQTVVRGTATIGEMATTVGRVTSIAAHLGVSFHEVAAAIATMTKGGMKAEIATTGLRGALLALLKSSAKFEEMGINIEKVLKEEGLSGGMRVLQVAIDKGAIATRKFVPDMRAMSAALSIGRDKAKDFKEALEFITDNEGARERAMKKQRQSLKFLVDEWQATADAVQEEVGSIIMEGFRRWASSTDVEGQKIVDWFRKLKEEGGASQVIADEMHAAADGITATAREIDAIKSLWLDLKAGLTEDSFDISGGVFGYVRTFFEDMNKNAQGGAAKKALDDTAAGLENVGRYAKDADAHVRAFWEANIRYEREAKPLRGESAKAEAAAAFIRKKTLDDQIELLRRKSELEKKAAEDELTNQENILQALAQGELEKQNALDKTMEKLIKKTNALNSEAEAEKILQEIIDGTTEGYALQIGKLDIVIDRELALQLQTQALSEETAKAEKKTREYADALASLSPEARLIRDEFAELYEAFNIEMPKAKDGIQGIIEGWIKSTEQTENQAAALEKVTALFRDEGVTLENVFRKMTDNLELTKTEALFAEVHKQELNEAQKTLEQMNEAKIEGNALDMTKQDIQDQINQKKKEEKDLEEQIFNFKKMALNMGSTSTETIDADKNELNKLGAGATRAANRMSYGSAQAREAANAARSGEIGKIRDMLTSARNTADAMRGRVNAMTQTKLESMVDFLRNLVSSMERLGQSVERSARAAETSAQATKNLASSASEASRSRRNSSRNVSGRGTVY